MLTSHLAQLWEPLNGPVAAAAVTPVLAFEIHLSAVGLRPGTASAPTRFVAEACIR